MYVAFTSYGKRLLRTGKGLKSLMKPHQTIEATKYIITVYKDDLKYLVANEYLMSLITRDKLRVVIAPENLKNNLKYFYAMQVYNDLPFVTVDDDVTYKPKTLETLYNMHTKYPDCVVGNITVPTHFNKPIINWIFTKNKSINEPSMQLMSEGVGGIIYPPRFFEYVVPWIDVIRDKEPILKNDDLMLHWIKHKNNIKTVDTLNRVSGKEQSITEIDEINPSWHVNYKGNDNLAQKAIDILQSIYRIR